MIFESDLNKMKRRETRLVVHVENVLDGFGMTKGVRSVFRLFDCSKKDLFWTMDEKGMKSEEMSLGRNEKLRMLLYGLGFWVC